LYSVVAIIAALSKQPPRTSSKLSVPVDQFLALVLTLKNYTILRVRNRCVQCTILVTDHHPELEDVSTSRLVLSTSLCQFGTDSSWWLRWTGVHDPNCTQHRSFMTLAPEGILTSYVSVTNNYYNERL